MHSFKKSLAISLGLGLGLGLAACSPKSTESSGVEGDTDQAGFVAGEPNGNGADPMAHIAYFSSDMMKGRNSPSSDLANAAGYIKTYLARHGLTDPNPTDAKAPYAQSFTISSFNAADALAGGVNHTHEQRDLSDPLAFGVTLFEEAFYLDDKLSPSAREAVTQRYKEAMAAEGKTIGTQTPSLAEMKAEALATGTVQNVIGKLAGTGTKSNEVIVVMAHLDHIGVTSGGTVFNGADDNASGSAVILSTLPALAAASKNGQLNRSVLFFWTAGEEKGLVGAQYFVDHPIAGIGLSNIAGVINMDMVARWDDQRLSVIDTTSAGGSANYFRALLNSANTSLPDPFDTLNRDIDTYIDRQDGWAFLNAGKDVIFLFEGLSNPGGGGSLMPDYHATGDDIDKITADNNGTKPGRVRDLLIDLVKRASNH